MNDSSADGQAAVPEVVNAELPDNAVLLDVRTDQEWAAGRAPHAIHIPRDQLEERLSEVPDADPLYVVCRNGDLSTQAAAFLREHGRDAVSVRGGMLEWRMSNRPMSHDGPGIPDVV